MKRQKERPANEKAELPAWLLGFFLVAITLMAYQPVWHAGFIWDDDQFLTDNPVIKSAQGLYQMWFTAATPDYFPMTSSLLWLEWRIWSNHPLGYHLVNVFLHAFSTVLLWRVLQRLKIPGALLAAAIFALHPVNVESVAWITERKNTLSMFFYLGAILAWLKFEDSGQGRWYGLALAGFTLALLSKTAVAPLPLVLLGFAWWRRGRVAWQDVRRIVPFFVIAAALAMVTVWFQDHQAIGNDVVRTDNFWSRLAGAGWAVWFYLYKAVLPLNLIFVYPRWQIDARNGLAYVPLILLTVAFVLCWRWRRGWGKAMFFGLAYFVVMLLPILGFLNIYFMRYSLVSDHWEYFAIIGPITLASAILIRKPALAAALLVALGMLTWRQCGMYANIKTLWQTTLQLNPGCWLAHNHLGYVLFYKEGQTDEAMAHFQKTLEINPDYAEAHYNLGNIFAQQGRRAEAIAHYQKALEIQPDFVTAHLNFGNILAQQGRMSEAVSQYQKALEINPDLAEAHYNLGRIFEQQRRLDEAIAHYQKTVELKPDHEAAQLNLGSCLCQQGRLREAIPHYQKALEIEPNDAAVRYNLGASYFKLGRTDEAIAQLQKAAAIKPGDAVMLDTLAAAYAEVGRFSEAMETAQRALRLAEEQSNPGLAGQIQAQLKSYQAGMPFHSHDR